MAKGIIFDLDGTLVDSLAGIAASLNHALRQHALPEHGLEAVRGFIGNGARVLVTRALSCAGEGDAVDRVEAAFKAHYDVQWRSGTTVYQGIIPLLEKLQAEGRALAVLSNKPHPFTVAIVEALFPSIHFQVVMGQLPGIPHKPDPGGAWEIANLTGMPAPEWVIVGDSTMDLETAVAAGMEAIAVTWGFHDRARLVEAGALWVADSPGELETLLEQVLC